MPQAGSTAGADSTDSTVEKMPTCDGSQIALASWLRELKRFEHLLPSDVAFWVVTGACSASGGKTAVASVQHALLLHNDLLEACDFSIVNPPPNDNKYVDLYASMRANGGENSPLPENATTLSAALKDQYLIAPARLKQMDLQYRNIILALITSPGRKNH